MPVIRLETFIAAPPDLCFDLSRSVDLHLDSFSRTRERAVAGVTSGLMGAGDEVTWEAVHFGVRQRFTSAITEFDRPRMFVDEMKRGAFRRFRHEHRYEPVEGGTLMIDSVDYKSPLGPLGELADALFVRSYLTRLLTDRNMQIKACAEARVHD